MNWATKRWKKVNWNQGVSRTSHHIHGLPQIVDDIVGIYCRSNWQLTIFYLTGCRWSVRHIYYEKKPKQFSSHRAETKKKIQLNFFAQTNRTEWKTTAFSYSKFNFLLFLTRRFRLALHQTVNEKNTPILLRIHFFHRWSFFARLLFTSQFSISWHLFYEKSSAPSPPFTWNFLFSVRERVIWLIFFHFVYVLQIFCMMDVWIHGECRQVWGKATKINRIGDFFILRRFFFSLFVFKFPFCKQKWKERENAQSLRYFVLQFILSQFLWTKRRQQQQPIWFRQDVNCLRAMSQRPKKALSEEKITILRSAQFACVRNWIHFLSLLFHCLNCISVILSLFISNGRNTKIICHWHSHERATHTHEQALT